VENIMSSKLFTTRQGTIMLGVIAALIAAVALIVYLHNYRNSVNGGNTPTKVLVAKSLIQKGTPGDVVGTSGLYETVTIPKSEVKSGAYIDPSTLTGKVALIDVYPNQQITAADFGVAPASVTQKLNPDERAVTLALGTPQTVGGQVVPGSHVDIWVNFNQAERLLYQNMNVLGVSGGDITLQATPSEAGTLIYASQNGTLYLALRPTVGTIQQKPPVITQNALTGH
jgi:Flp pilus assembly protein CpaB